MSPIKLNLSFTKQILVQNLLEIEKKPLPDLQLTRSRIKKLKGIIE